MGGGQCKAHMNAREIYFKFVSAVSDAMTVLGLGTFLERG